MILNLQIFRHGCWISAIWPLHVAHDSGLLVGISEIKQEAIQLHRNCGSACIQAKLQRFQNKFI
jgi:hypothetical protein